MAVSPETEAFISELFEDLGPILIKRMFGGAGVFVPSAAGDVMFALIADDVLYLKMADANKADFEAESCEPFTYEAKNGKRSVMSYGQLPERLYDDPAEACAWAQKSIEIALANHKPKKRKPSASKRKPAKPKNRKKA